VKTPSDDSKLSPRERGPIVKREGDRGVIEGAPRPMRADSVLACTAPSSISQVEDVSYAFLTGPGTERSGEPWHTARLRLGYNLSRPDYTGVTSVGRNA